MSRDSGNELGFIRRRCHPRLQGTVCIQMWPVSALFTWIYAYYTHYLSMHTIRNTIAGIGSTTLLCVHLFPELIQLMDNDIV